MSTTANETRKSAFKKGLDREDARKKREDTVVELRKSKREESLLKRRALHEHDAPDEDAMPGADGTPTRARSATREEIPALVQGCYVEATALECVTSLRKLLSLENNPPIDAVIGSGVVPQLVNLLSAAVDGSPRLQFEAAWCLTNVASGSSEQTSHVARAGAIPAFVRLLSSPDENTCEQAFWALGNIAGDSATLRDAVLDAGVMVPLLRQIQAGPKLSLLRNTVWFLSNLCRGKPPPSLAKIAPAVPVLAQLLMSITDEETISDTLWALSYITDGEQDGVAAVLASGVTLRLVSCLTHASSKVKVPALRTIGNIVTGTDEQTQQVVDAGALLLLGQLVTASTKLQERKEACWAISNIAAGSRAQLSATIESGVLLPVVRALKSAEYLEIKKEACWVVCNAAHGLTGSAQQLLQMVEQYGALEPMCDMLQAPDAKMVTITLDFIAELCAAGESVAAERGEGENKVVLWLNEVGGIDKLEELQEHKNEDVYRKAVAILEKYVGDADEEDALAAPAVCASGEQFEFGLEPHQLLSHQQMGMLTF